MITEQDIHELSKGVKTVYKQFSDGGILTLRLTSNPTILESFGFKEGILDVDSKLSINIESIQDFNIAEGEVKTTDLYKKMKPMLIALYYIDQNRT